MRLRMRLVAAVLVALAPMCALPARALASSSEESILMDDAQLIYASPAQVAWTLQQAKSLGIDRVKVSVVWLLVAPNPNSKHRPNFDATNPAAYPYGAWTRYDRIVSFAQALGLKIYFQLVPPAPAWALAKTKPTQGYPWSHQPSPSEFGKFAEAVARRYSGSYAPMAANDRPRGALQLPVPVPGVSQPSPPPPATLPRVNYWGIWNEPNEGAWLNPQWRLVGRGPHPRLFYVAPAMYRALANSAVSALQASGHGNDTIIIGETASHGWIYPLPFVRALYCVDANEQPLRGIRARQLECPPSGNRSAFATQNPGLFDITGYAHHPYSFDVPPNTRLPDRNLITLQNLGLLEHDLDAIYANYGRRRAGGIPMYLTEWGYKTNPPNPFVHTSPVQQATWLNQGEYMTWQDPRVRSLAQFLLVDDNPRAGSARGSRSYWGTFQTGLLYANKKPKPAYTAFRIPIWLSSPRHGARVSVWGQLRPASHAGLQRATLQYQPVHTTAWRDIDEIQTASPEGFLLAHVSIPAAGQVRLAWTDPASGATEYSRTVGIA